MCRGIYNVKACSSGRRKAITRDPGNLFAWPIITKEDEDAVLKYYAPRRHVSNGRDKRV